MISEADVAAYRRDGVIVVPEVMDRETLTRVRQVIAELVAGAAEVSEHTDVYDLEPSHTRENPRVRRIKTPHKVHPIFNEIVRSQKVIDTSAAPATSSEITCRTRVNVSRSTTSGTTITPSRR